MSIPITHLIIYGEIKKKGVNYRYRCINCNYEWMKWRIGVYDKENDNPDWYKYLKYKCPKCKSDKWTLISDSSSSKKIINIKSIKPIIKWRVRIPQKYYFKIVQELCEYKLLRKVSRDDYEILYCGERAPVDSLGEPFW